MSDLRFDYGARLILTLDSSNRNLIIELLNTTG